MPLGDFTVARDDLDIEGAVPVGSGGSCSDRCCGVLPAEGSTMVGFSSKPSIKTLPIRWILCRMTSLVCLAFDMLTVMQHSDTNPVALAGFNELANCSWGNDERELPGFLLVFTRRNTDLVLNELLGSTV